MQVKLYDVETWAKNPCLALDNGILETEIVAEFEAIGISKLPWAWRTVPCQPHLSRMLAISVSSPWIPILSGGERASTWTKRLADSAIPHEILEETLVQKSSEDLKKVQIKPTNLFMITNPFLAHSKPRQEWGCGH